MKTSDFDYELPEERIANHPLKDRTSSKLLVYADGATKHDVFANIAKHLPPKCLLILNDTKVIAARLKMVGSRGDEIEIFLLEPFAQDYVSAFAAQGSANWLAMVGGRKKWKAEEEVFLDAELDFDLRATWADRENNIVKLEWEPSKYTFSEVLSLAGNVPLPPYIKRRTNKTDRSSYQSVFAAKEGAVAAPTASLHITEDLLAQLASAGHETAKVTLHVSAGTFKPVSTELMEEHEMHKEYYEVQQATIAKLAEWDGPIVAVGTTALRTLETLFWRGANLAKGGQDMEVTEQNFAYTALEDIGKTAWHEAMVALQKLETEHIVGKSGIFILPGYDVRSADYLITNFHQPSSTLLALISAFVGDAWREIYRTALAREYRFLSYGDGSLLKKARK